MAELSAELRLEEISDDWLANEELALEATEEAREEAELMTEAMMVLLVAWAGKVVVDGTKPGTEEMDMLACWA